MKPKRGVYMKMMGGELTQLRWMNSDDQEEFLNYTEKRMNTFRKNEQA